MKNNRRSFIKLAAVAAAGIAVAPKAAVAAGGHAAPIKKNPEALEAKRWGMVIDTTKLHTKEEKGILSRQL